MRDEKSKASDFFGFSLERHQTLMDGGWQDDPAAYARIRLHLSVAVDVHSGYCVIKPLFALCWQVATLRVRLRPHPSYHHVLFTCTLPWGQVFDEA